MMAHLANPLPTRADITYVYVLVVGLLIPPSLSPAKIADWPTALVPCTHVEDLEQAPSSWHDFHSAIAILAI